MAGKALRRWLLSAALAALGPLTTATTATTAAVPAPPPRVWLWAWDRPEDLRFLDPAEAGVAFFVLGIQIKGPALSLRPRTAPLRLAPGTRRIAVVRLDVSARDLPEPVLTEVLAAIRTQALVPGIEGLQLDFDALRSQRPFYRRLLTRLRRERISPVPVTVTALASWCMGDPWIADLPVDGAVAMLFQLGPEAGEALAWLARKRPLSGIQGRPLAWGLGTGQALPSPPPADARVFLFHPRPWTRPAFQQALAMVTQ